MQTRPSQILEWLFLGSMWSANHNNLTTLNIHFVLNVKGGSYPDYMSSEQYCIVPISDHGDTDLEKVLPKCFDHICTNQILIIYLKAKNQSKKIIVHCEGGINRSPSVVIAYLVKYEGYSLKRACEHVVVTRPSTRPLDVYITRLEELEKKWKGESTLTPEDRKRIFPPIVFH